MPARPPVFDPLGRTQEQRDAQRKAYVREHRTKADAKRPSSHQRGYNSKWREQRAAFLQSNPLCAEHLKCGEIVVASVVDHVVPHKGDAALFWNHSNWQSLCEKCHNAKTAREDGGFGHGKNGHG